MKKSKHVKVIELKIYLDNDTTFNATLNHRCANGHSALDLIQDFVRIHRKELNHARPKEKSDA